MLRFLAAIALLTACSHSDAVANSAAAAPAPAAASTASANGTLASTGAAPRDSISDRADRGRITGDSTATIWVLMASDFQCPYCKQWHDAAFAAIRDSYAKTGKVRMAFINLPLSMHPNAMPAAEAAMCASVQNKFWPMHDALFASQKEWEVMPNPTPKFEALAGSIGVDLTAWRQCVSGHQTAALIQADRDRIRKVGVISTPTFFVDGHQVPGGADADVRGAIEAALRSRPGQ